MLNETVVVNNPIHLECRASGNPLPGMRTHLGEPEAALIQAFICLLKIVNVQNVELILFFLNYLMLYIMGNVNI